LILIEHISPSQYSYELPDNRIAAFPADRRDNSRLLVHNANGHLHEDVFSNIASYFPENSELFFNNSKVIPARLIFPTLSGPKVEIFCLRPTGPSGYAGALSATRSSTWECMIGNMKKFKEPVVQLPVQTDKGILVLAAEKIRLSGNTAEIRFTWDHGDISFAEIISIAGRTPLPPYIKRDPVPADRERYQTVYSKIDGSVAAPTAGLHFTDEVLRTLAEKRIAFHEITLHVGAGTFQPIKTGLVKDHKMHAEYFEVTRSMAEELACMKKRVTCVGTTTVRTLESLYWIGARFASVPDVPDSLHLGQWEPYSLRECPVSEAFDALARWFRIMHTEKVMASTSFMIVPGYRFKMTDKLITNFHQPGSTLLLLIAAFIGDSWKKTYNYALLNGFRFLSYGDSSLLYNSDTA